MKYASALTGTAMQHRGMRTILAADRDRAELGALAQQLGMLGYLVVLAESGAQALELISARSFDLVLLGRELPDLSGIHVLQEIRGARDTADLPVVLLAAESDPLGATGAVGALAVGADDYLARPFAFEVLAARIARIVARADRIGLLKRSNLALDARIAARAIELGEVRAELAAVLADRTRLTAASLARKPRRARAPALQ